MIRSLLAGAIDYAGLFPPAALPMRAAVANYAAYRQGADAWALGRFVVPAARLAELGAAVEGGGSRDGCWGLSVLVGEFAADRAHLQRFADLGNRPDRDRWVTADSFEFRASSAADVSAIATFARESEAGKLAFVEVPSESDPASLLDAVAGAGLAAKIRTGGVTAAQFPPARDVARFLMRCAERGLPFKATAGLHHPIRAEYRLTYDETSPTGTMYGFLNLLVASAAAHAAAGGEEIVAILEERDVRAFDLTPDGAGYRGRTFERSALEAVRASFALSFGSCSFEEPLTELRTLGLL